MLHANLLFDRARQAAQQPHDDWSTRFSRLTKTAKDSRLQRFYAAGAVCARTPLKEVPLLALDVETTGLDPKNDGIVSIGVIPMSIDRIWASQGRHWLVAPRVPLNETSITLHGITHQNLHDAPDLDDVLEEVLQEMEGRVIVVHCRDLERQFLSQALIRRIGEGIVFPVIDTMELEARLYRQHKPVDWLRWIWPQKTWVSIRLSASRARYGLPRYRLHHALTDALASAELLQAQVGHRFDPNTPVGDLWQ